MTTVFRLNWLQRVIFLHCYFWLNAECCSLCQTKIKSCGKNIKNEPKSCVLTNDTAQVRVKMDQCQTKTGKRRRHNPYAISCTKSPGVLPLFPRLIMGSHVQPQLIPMLTTIAFFFNQLFSPAHICDRPMFYSASQFFIMKGNIITVFSLKLRSISFALLLNTQPIQISTHRSNCVMTPPLFERFDIISNIYI